MSTQDNQKVLTESKTRIEEIAMRALSSNNKIKRFGVSINVHGQKLSKPRIQIEYEG